MDIFSVIALAFGLAMDASAVSLGVGASDHGGGVRPAFRLSFHFGLFQFLMPVIGWFLGASVEFLVAPIDHWIAFGLLCYVGVRMIRSGLQSSEELYSGDPTRGLSLVMLSVATSIDALAIGLSLGMMNITIWYPAAVIGVVTAGLSLLGLTLGRSLGSRFGKRMELAGGTLLCLIGLRIVLAHLGVLPL